MMTIHDVFVGQRVRSMLDATPGEVVEVDYTAVKVRWEDGCYSIFRKQDGFTGFVPRDLKDVEAFPKGSRA